MPRARDDSPGGAWLTIACSVSIAVPRRNGTAPPNIS